MLVHRPRLRLPRHVLSFLLGPGLVLAPGLVHGARDPRPEAPPAVVVVAANTILADITREVAGDRFDVRCLVPPGVDLHGFEPHPSDVAVLATARLVIANGAGFEPWLARLLAGSGYSGPVVEAIAGVPLIHRAEAGSHLHAGPDLHDGLDDPHAWQNPAHGIRYALNIRDALVRAVPDCRVEIGRRTRLYVSQLEILDAWMRRLFAALPPDRRSIVTAHDSFAYLGAAYGLEIIPVRGLDSRQEPDARRIAALVDLLRAKKVRAIFFEPVSNPRMLEQLARDTGAVLGGALHTGSLGPAGSLADSYLGMLRENALRIVSELERP